MRPALGKRIIVIGSPGAGKSTFSAKLSRITGIELHHLDRIYWQPGWVPVSNEEFDFKLNEVLSAESWIIDGNYQRTLQLRYSRADTVIFLDFNRYLCLYRSINRRFLSRDRRLDITEGCEEKIDTEFLKWIWNYRRRDRPETLQIICQSEDRDID